MEKHKPKFTRKMKRRLESMKNTEWTHEEAQKFLGIEITIRNMVYYMDAIDLIYDWKKGIWRNRIPLVDPYRRTLALLKSIHGDKYTDEEYKILIYGNRRAFKYM